jgi:uncharacterized repeat protein (TIGR01451 family)
VKTKRSFLFPWLVRLSILCCIVFLAGFGPAIAYSQEIDFYYYSDGRKITLSLSKETLAVRFKPEVTLDQQRGVVESKENLSSFSERKDIPIPKITLLPLQQGVTEETAIQTINSLDADENIEFASPVFDFPDARLILTDEFIVKFDPNISEAEIESFNALNNVEIVSREKWANWYVLRVKTPKNTNALKMANLYYESSLTEFSVPNFVRILQPMFVTPDDTYFPNQWNLSNTGQSGGTPHSDIDAPHGWMISTGSSDIVIAIIDEGVDLTHQDLVNTLVSGWDFVDYPPGDNDPSPWNDDAHGTACAGIAAAQTNNTIGVSGVAWGCKIMPVRVAYGFELGWITNDYQLASGIWWAADNGADVLSNSWGMGSPSSVVLDAIRNAKNNGRNGLGCVIVFASGNYNTSVSYPAKYPEVIAVGATDHNDIRWNITPSRGSNYGTELDIVAPSGWTSNEGVIFWATDITGSAGYNPGNTSEGDAAGNYTRWFGGTSAAAPQVAGLAGLILSVNPNLTSDEVQSIIESTADDKGASGRDDYYGYGRINLFNALAIANASGLSLDKVDNINDGNGVSIGDDITYTISYANPITDPYDPHYIGNVNDVIITDLLPDDIAFVSASGPNSVYNPSAHTVTWNIGTLEPSDSCSVTLTVKVKDYITVYGIIKNICKIEGGSYSRWACENTPVCIASHPMPTDGKMADLCAGVVSLTWCPGYFAANSNGHEVYFGTNFGEVNDANTSSAGIYKGTVTNPSYSIQSNNLEFGTTYYWRVDEVNTIHPAIRWKGSVWSFTADCYLVENFESYGTNNPALRAVWVKSSSATTIIYTSPIAHSGDVSMEFDYTNSSSPYYAEVTATIGTGTGKLVIDPNWLGRNAELLSLWFYGQPTNDANEQMYIKLTDGDTPIHTATVNYPDMDDVREVEWHQWNIPLAAFTDVNLRKVAKISIGFGDETYPGADPNGRGIVYFDDIGLHLMDLMGSCSPGYYPLGDFAVFALAWLTSSGQPNYNPVCDISISKDETINEYDLARFCDYWLWREDGATMLMMASGGASHPTADFGEGLSAPVTQELQEEMPAEQQPEEQYQDDYQQTSMLAGPNETPGIWMVYDGNMLPDPNDEITVYIHSDPMLLCMGIGVEVVGDANITTAMSESDCNSFGWDNGWNSDPYIDPAGWIYISGVSWECTVNGTVSYFKFRYNSGEVTVSIIEGSEAFDAYCQPVLFSPQPLIFGQDPNQ